MGESVQHWKPWEQSTGPKTPEGSCTLCERPGSQFMLLTAKLKRICGYGEYDNIGERKSKEQPCAKVQ